MLGVHGINQYIDGAPGVAAQQIGGRWLTAIRQGLRDVAFPRVSDVGLQIAYYAPELHDMNEPGLRVLRTPAPLGSRDVTIPPQALGAVRDLLETGNRVMSSVNVTASATERFGIAISREVDTYLRDPRRRAACRKQVMDAIERGRPRIVLGHSLGSIVAYEALHATAANVDLFVTFGSPLGAKDTVGAILDPPLVDGWGVRPPGVRRWVNVAAAADLVPVVQNLASAFHGVDADIHPVIGPRGTHAATRYLRTPAFGGVLAQALSLT